MLDTVLFYTWLYNHFRSVGEDSLKHLQCCPSACPPVPKIQIHSLISHRRTSVNLSNHIFSDSWWHTLAPTKTMLTINTHTKRLQFQKAGVIKPVNFLLVNQNRPKLPVQSVKNIFEYLNILVTNINSGIRSYQFFFYKYIRIFVCVYFVCTKIFRHWHVSVLEWKN